MIWLRLTEVVRKEDILIWQRFYRVPSSEHNVLINSFTQFAQSHSPKVLMDCKNKAGTRVFMFSL